MKSFKRINPRIALSKVEVEENFTLEKIDDYILMYDSWAGNPNKNNIKKAHILSETTDYYFCEEWKPLQTRSKKWK